MEPVIRKNKNVVTNWSYGLGKYIYIYTAISRKVVGKGARDNPERHCGFEFSFFFSKEIWKYWYERPHANVFASVKGKQQK